MTAKLIIDINYLTFDRTGTIDISPLTITNDLSKRKEFINSDIINGFGSVILNYPPTNAYAYGVFEIDTTNKLLPIIQKEISHMATLLCQGLGDYLNFFWFVKDNSITVGEAIVYIPEIKDSAVKIRIPSIKNTCTGKREDTCYNSDEINFAQEISGRAEKLCPNVNVFIADHTEWEEDKDGKPIKGSMGHHEDFDYSKFNVFQRAFQFLGSARKLDLILYKIAAYIPVFECIFTTDRTEVTQKVCERTSFYLEGDIEQQIAVFNDIYAAYGLRSAYLHGQKPAKSTSNKDLKNLSTRLDELLRAILIMILLYDSDTFKDDDLRSIYLKYLIMGKGAYLCSPEYKKMLLAKEDKMKQKENQSKTSAKSKKMQPNDKG